MAKLVPNICVSVPNEPEHMEAECQESGAKQVPQSSQVWDGEVVGVQAPAPHPVHHPVCDVQENQHLGRQRVLPVATRFLQGEPEATKLDVFSGSQGLAGHNLFARTAHSKPGAF